MSRLAISLLLAATALGQTRVRKADIQVLSTMLTDNNGIGEWGFAAMVDVDGRRILFDTGARPDTVSKNLGELKVDLAGVTDVILSHNHGDHTGGLMTLRRDAMPRDAKALSRAHVGKGIFAPRQGWMAKVRAEYEATGAKFVEHDSFAEVAPGVWLTGPVPRKHPERNWSGSDNVPEDMSMVLDTPEGLVLISGCGHAGIINTVEHARHKFGARPLVA
ncbi:MAG: MBL fold metallo-hydrolase, partial [Acidobacteria bacterium]|nr:MBL fold metallo-hydrolase [Acidobacteriota bacterium]